MEEPAALPSPASPLAVLPVTQDPDQPCLFLEQDAAGLWSGLFCLCAREDATETLVYLQRHYPDGLARLRPLGDLMALGGTPEHCDALDADGEYVPARHADYPPEAAPLGHALEVWNAIKPLIRYTYLYYPAEAGSPGGWVVRDAWGRSLPA